MVDQNTFIETVQSVSQIIRTSAEPIGREEIMSYFKDMDLNKAQEDLIFDFLLNHHDEPENGYEDVETENTDEVSEKNSDIIYSEGEPIGQKKDTASDENDDGFDEDSLIPDSPMFKMYLEELDEIPEYSKEEQDELYKKLLNGDESVIHTISNMWLKSVLDMAKKLAVTKEGFEDVVQEGNMALFMHLTELCGAGENENIEDEILEVIEAAMKECIRNQTGESENENAMVGKVSLVSRAVEHLKSKNGTDPSAQELSDYTSVPADELSSILELLKKATQKDDKKA